MNTIYFFILLILYFLIHSILATEKIKKCLIANVISERFYRLFYNVIAIITLIPVLLMYLFMPHEVICIFPLIINILGGLMFLFSGLALIRAIMQYDLGEFSGLAQFRGDKSAGKQLVISGMNAYVRHPLYTASLLMQWSAFLVLPYISHLIIAIIGTVYLVVGSILEEQKLVKVFGEAYRKYQKDVPMLLPRLGRKKE